MLRRGGIAVFAAALAGPGSAQAPANPLTITPLGGGAYVVEGGRTRFTSVNTGFIIGDKGVIAVDAQDFAAVARSELAEIAKITPKPVDTILITHSDSDHINGLPGFPRGTTIIAQENAAAEMQAILTDPNPRGGPPPPELKDYQPTHTVRRSEAMVIDGVRIVLTHVAGGHTDGDLVIYLPAQRTVFAGDLVTVGAAGIPTGGLYPIIHLNKHGSSAGWIRAVKAMLALDADKFVGGHGSAVRDRATLEAALKATEQRRAEIKQLFDEGKSLADIKAALGEAELPLRFPTFTETTFEELSQE